MSTSRFPGHCPWRDGRVAPRMTLSSYMNAPLSIRVDQRTRRSLARLARQSRRSQSAVVREAIDAFVAKAPAVLRPYDAWREVLGSADSGIGNLSEQTGAKFRDALIARKSAAR